MEKNVVGGGHYFEYQTLQKVDSKGVLVNRYLGVRVIDTTVILDANKAEDGGTALCHHKSDERVDDGLGGQVDVVRDLIGRRLLNKKKKMHSLPYAIAYRILTYSFSNTSLWH